MIVPDHISPVIAYRVWQWDILGLKSLNNEQWLPGCALEANALRCGEEHAAPSDGCRCGVYAAKNFAHLRGIGYAGFGVHGEVYLWGTVVPEQLADDVKRLTAAEKMARERAPQIVDSECRARPTAMALGAIPSTDPRRFSAGFSIPRQTVHAKI